MHARERRVEVVATPNEEERWREQTEEKYGTGAPQSNQHTARA